MKYEFPKTVAEAAKILDQAKPGWHMQVSLSRLSMTMDTDCILGQVYGDYLNGLKALFADPNIRLMYSNHPFITGKDEWTHEIKLRLNSGKFGTPTSTQEPQSMLISTVKSVNPLYTKSFPKIMRFKGGATEELYVLFTCDNKGTVVASNIKHRKVGDYDVNWAPTLFEDVEVEITLKS